MLTVVLYRPLDTIQSRGENAAGDWGPDGTARNYSFPVVRRLWKFCRTRRI
jgi:hypothetical protein